MLKIDIHTHILPPKIPKRRGILRLQPHACGKYSDLLNPDGSLFRKVGQNCFDPEMRLQECQRLGVHVQVLSTIPAMFNYHIGTKNAEYMAQFLNDHIAETVRQHPQNFIGLGTLPMQYPKLAIHELHRCREQLQLAGVQIGSHINDKNLSHKDLRDIFQAAEELEMAIFVHPWDMMGWKRMPQYWLPWLVGMPAEVSLAICSMIFGGVFERYPKLRVAFAHGGGAFPITVGRVVHGFVMRPDLCATDNQVNPQAYLGHFWLDSLVHSAQALSYIIKLVGEDKVCLGSDYPFPLGEQLPGMLIESLNLSPSSTQALLSHSALDWLGLNKQNYQEECDGT